MNIMLIEENVFSLIVLVLFWISICAVIYAFVGYPLVLKIISFFYRVPIQKARWKPSVTLIISAYNEENGIAAKIENSLALDYPKEKLEIMVISDASSDKTEEISKAYESAGVITLRVEGRIGKSSCLNKVVPLAHGEIIVFSDANSLYDEKAIHEIVQNFADSTIGCVTGYTKYRSHGVMREIESVGAYTFLEKMTKELESQIDSCVGADGTIFAIRKNLYRSLKATDINDLVIPLNIIAQKYRTVIETGAFCFEESANDLKSEFDRQVRITNRTLRAIFDNRELLNIFHYGIFSFELISHKLIKFLVPLFLPIAFSSNLILFRWRPFYRSILLIQVVFYMLSSMKGTMAKGTMALNPLSRLINACKTYVGVNLAIAKGWLTYIQGKDFTTWKTIRSENFPDNVE
jgi:cellulose synthase/poly-beta-1,6-N-acetylglucosamine synthase-like glycosyltransferase